MNIVSISDIHGLLPLDLPSGDTLTISGDICPDNYSYTGIDYFTGTDFSSFGRRFQFNWLKNKFLPWCDGLISSGSFCNIIFIAGNHDSVFEDSNTVTRLRFPIGVHYLQDSGIDIDGVKFYGTPWCNQFFDWSFMGSEEFLHDKFSLIPAGLDVLLSHSPVYGYGDDIRSFDNSLDLMEIKNVGSRSLLEHVARANPRYVLTGHIHCGSHDEGLFKDTTIVNVSVLNDSYKRNMYSPFKFKVDVGVGC